MKRLIRKTLTGTEYWDTKDKRTVFAPAGKEPDFEVTDDTKAIVVGLELASGKDKTVIDGKVVDTNTDINLDKMNVDELKTFAEQNDIKVPGTMKNEETIRNHIVAELEK